MGRDTGSGRHAHCECVNVNAMQELFDEIGIDEPGTAADIHSNTAAGTTATTSSTLTAAATDVSKQTEASSKAESSISTAEKETSLPVPPPVSASGRVATAEQKEQKAADARMRRIEAAFSGAL